jgi:hypothetical protein
VRRMPWGLTIEVADVAGPMDVASMTAVR